jgi:hypothetical protein
MAFAFFSRLPFLRRPRFAPALFAGQAGVFVLAELDKQTRHARRVRAAAPYVIALNRGRERKQGKGYAGGYRDARPRHMTAPTPSLLSGASVNGLPRMPRFHSGRRVCAQRVGEDRNGHTYQDAGHGAPSDVQGRSVCVRVS